MPTGPDPVDHQRALFERAVTFASEHLSQDISDQDRKGAFDRDGWKLCTDFGLLRMAMPNKETGQLPPLSDLITVMEGLGYASYDEGLLFGLNAHLWTTLVPLVLHGTPEQKRRYLNGLTDGSLIGANASTEPEAGSDVYAMTTHAEPSGDGYVLNGTKTYITNAPVADVFVIYASLDPQLGPTGITAFLIDADTPGLHRSPAFDKMGLRTAAMGALELKDCWVPATTVLGRPGRGVTIFDSAMEHERGCILATCLGVMRRQLETCVHHARSRHQFNQPIGRFQAVSHRIADMKVRLDAARALVHRVGELKDAGQDATLEAASAKLFVSEAYLQSSLDTVRTHGAQGYLAQSSPERELRNSVGSVIYSGTSDIQRNIIAGHLGLGLG